MDMSEPQQNVNTTDNIYARGGRIALSEKNISRDKVSLMEPKKFEEHAYQSWKYV